MPLDGPGRVPPTTEKVDASSENSIETTALAPDIAAVRSHPFPVDRDQIAAFADTLFRYADDGTYLQLRAFDEKGPFGAWRSIKLDGSGLGAVVDAAVVLAQQCADASGSVVFAPPIVALDNPKTAKEEDIANGLALSVDLDDGNLAEALEVLERLLGPATLVVASGGELTNPETGEDQPKLHGHWRLQEPTRTLECEREAKAAAEGVEVELTVTERNAKRADHYRLKEARRLAQMRVGSDGSATPIVHPFRWPGSWHRKGEPRLAKIVQLNADAEIDLGEALVRLRDAVVVIPAPGMLLSRPIGSKGATASKGLKGLLGPTVSSLAGVERCLRAATEGERNQLLFWAACRFAEAIASRLIGEEDARKILRHASRSTGLADQEIAKTIDNGFSRAGA